MTKLWLCILQERRARVHKIVMRSISTDKLDRQLTLTPSTEAKRSRAAVFFAFLIAMLYTNPGMKIVVHGSRTIYLSSAMLQKCSLCATNECARP